VSLDVVGRRVVAGFRVDVWCRMVVGLCVVVVVVVVVAVVVVFDFFGPINYCDNRNESKK